MKKLLDLFIPGNPKALKRHRTFRRAQRMGSYDPSKNDKADFLALAMRGCPEKPFSGPLYLKVWCYFPRPKAHYRTGKFSDQLKDTAPGWHVNTPDADNLGKFVCDALNGMFWIDDKCISRLEVEKQYGDVPGTFISLFRLNKAPHHRIIKIIRKTKHGIEEIYNRVMGKGSKA